MTDAHHAERSHIDQIMMKRDRRMLPSCVKDVDAGLAELAHAIEAAFE